MSKIYSITIFYQQQNVDNKSIFFQFEYLNYICIKKYEKIIMPYNNNL